MIKIKRIEAGFYQTEDSRFSIRDLYVPGSDVSSPEFVGRNDARWRFEDSTEKVQPKKFHLLLDAKNYVEEVLEKESKG